MEKLRCDMKKGVYLNHEVVERFATLLNSKYEFFAHANDCKLHYNLLCVSKDRISTCVAYLNSHPQTLSSEETLILFFVYGAMLKDSIEQLLKHLQIENPLKNDSSFFKEICIGEPLYISSDKCPSDDKFFEYIRSLAFAHPYETSRPKFLNDGEIHYSPFISNEVWDEGCCAIVIYSNQFRESKILAMPIKTIKKYFTSRYELLEDVIKWLEDRVKNNLCN